MSIINILSGLIAILFVLVPHELAHAYVAYKCGDATAKMQGRLTLNSIKHLDIYGFVLFIFTGFGWAKPVPIDPYNFKNFRRGLFLTAIAGVVVNYVIAFISYALYRVFYVYVYVGNIAFWSQSGFLSTVGVFLPTVFLTVYIYSLSVFIFNLLPLYPLDGFRVVESLTRQINPVRRFLRNYGMYILIFLVLESYLCGILVDFGFPIAQYFDVLGYVHWFAEEIIGYPIMALWNFVIPG